MASLLETAKQVLVQNTEVTKLGDLPPVNENKNKVPRQQTFINKRKNGSSALRRLITGLQILAANSKGPMKLSAQDLRRRYGDQLNESFDWYNELIEEHDIDDILEYANELLEYTDEELNELFGFTWNHPEAAAASKGVKSLNKAAGSLKKGKQPKKQNE